MMMTATLVRAESRPCALVCARRTRTAAELCCGMLRWVQSFKGGMLLRAGQGLLRRGVLAR